MNPIVEELIKIKNGHYVHALEVETAYELQSIIDTLIDELSSKYNLETLLDFFNTMQIYCISESDEDHTEVDRFNVERYVRYIMG